MAQNKNNLKLDTLRQEIRHSLETFAEKLMEQLGDNLQSITVVGSSLTEDFKPGQSDINTVLLVSKQTIDCLEVIAGMAKSMSKRNLSVPLLMTADYIDRSRDVFGIEFLDLQLIHQTILGNDPFEKLAFSKADVRLQCERELKAMLIRLRQGYIAAAANRRLVRDILVSAAKGLSPLLRAILWLKDADRPRESRPTFEKVAREFSLNMDSVAAARKWQHQRTRLSEDEMKNVFESVYKTVDELAIIVDELKV